MVNKLAVFYREMEVGSLASMPDGYVAFQYSKEWLTKGFSVSPISLPLSDKLFIPKRRDFNGLFGVFSDSLPDSWGRRLVDRVLMKNGISPTEASPLLRLSLVSNNGLGALTYEPHCVTASSELRPDLDIIKQECDALMDDKKGSDFDLIYHLGGSSGGARPKVHLRIEGEDWIVKFPLSYDPPNAGRMEFDYNEAASQLGIEVPVHRLFPSQRCNGYFGTKRFDRDENGLPLHVISLSGLLDISHEIPCLDYVNLLELIGYLTKDKEEVMKGFARMCFNVYGHNYDDHAKNFSFIYFESEKKYRLSPAYDLTFDKYKTEHEMMVCGKGDPNDEDLLEAARKAKLNIPKCRTVMKEVKSIVSASLKWYFELADRD